MDLKIGDRTTVIGNHSQAGRSGVVVDLIPKNNSVRVRLDAKPEWADQTGDGWIIGIENIQPQAVCVLCGQPMPDGEEMFKYHGYSGPCPSPTLTKHEDDCDCANDPHANHDKECRNCNCEFGRDAKWRS